MFKFNKCSIMNLLILFVVLANSVQMHASKAHHVSFPVTLQDGRTTIVTLYGDENFSYYLSTEREIVVLENGIWRVASQQELRLQQSKQLSYLTPTPGISSSRKPFPCKGTPKVLVIMVSFQDQDFIYSKSDVEKWLNGDEFNERSPDKLDKYWTSYGSVAAYFNYCSKGQFRPQFDVVGPYKLDNNVSRYASKSARADLIPHGCAKADADVDFSQYDNDGDGMVDLVYVFYAGLGENWGNKNVPWPCSSYSTSSTKYDGKILNRWGISNELAGKPGMENDFQTDKLPMEGIGVFCHEFCHTLGLPDLYPTVAPTTLDQYDNQSMEGWDLMDYGENLDFGFSPLPLSPFECAMFGWDDDIVTITESGDYMSVPFNADNHKAYQIKNTADATGNEYYILQTMKKDSHWFRKVPGEGLLVTHVNCGANDLTNFSSPNNVFGKPRYTILPANGILYTSYRGSSSDEKFKMPLSAIQESWKGNVYPGTESVTSITDWKEYTPSMNFKVTDIVQNEDKTVSFKFDNGTPSGINNVHISADKLSNGRIYTCDGRFVGYNLSALPKGIYIRNGVKIAK